MKLTDKRKAELKVWAYECWNLSWKELAPVSNSRAQFLKYVERDNFDDKELDRIKLAIQAQAIHWRRLNKKEKVIGIPTLSVWLNQKRYDDEFIDESCNVANDFKKVAEKCAKDNCDEDVHGENYQHCAKHIPSKSNSMLKDAFESMGLDKSSPDFVEKCRQLCRGSMRQIVAKSDVMK